MQEFHTFIQCFWNDEDGVIVSAELVLIATLCVLPMVVGLSELTYAINSELGDVAYSFVGSNQYSSSNARDWNNGNDTSSCDIAGYRR